ncbi:MAG TPA: GNAT family N-acetyltransferase [Blastocatellia bacterium]|nr:GNAT family N-acetyltransferase [Blastocatellia bacterium]
MAVPEIRTTNLRLRPFTPDDVDNIRRLWTDPGVRKYLWDDEVISRDEAASAVQKSVELFGRDGLGLWAVFPGEEDPLIGFGGYWFFHEPPELQILYGIAPTHWGRGLAVEVARAMIRYGFEHLRLDQIVGSTDAPNQASRRVMEKAGMKFEKQVDQNGLDTMYYTIVREDFQPDDHSICSGRFRADSALTVPFTWC